MLGRKFYLVAQKYYKDSDITIDLLKTKQEALDCIQHYARLWDRKYYVDDKLELKKLKEIINADKMLKEFFLYIINDEDNENSPFILIAIKGDCIDFEMDSVENKVEIETQRLGIRNDRFWD
jgi:hypothetical protein